jgi:glycosyltransferase involved in cell wall biosynthesis
MIRALMTELRLLNDRFIFTGAIPDEELAIYYRHAAVYISLSEHEGFCVPLVEAMAAGVPVLAYSAAAVPDTLGGAGVSSRPRISNTPRSCSAPWRSTTICATG